MAAPGNPHRPQRGFFGTTKTLAPSLSHCPVSLVELSTVCVEGSLVIPCGWCGFSGPAPLVLPSFQHLLELNPHEETPEPTLKHCHDLGQTLVPHVLELGQDACSEEHLGERHMDLRIAPLSPKQLLSGDFTMKEQEVPTGPSEFRDPGKQLALAWTSARQGMPASASISSRSWTLQWALVLALQLLAGSPWTCLLTS